MARRSHGLLGLIPSVILSSASFLLPIGLKGDMLRMMAGVPASEKSESSPPSASPPTNGDVSSNPVVEWSLAFLLGRGVSGSGGCFLLRDSSSGLLPRLVL